MVIINSFEEYQAYTGKEIGSSDWHKIDQDQINRFADATLDHQFIPTKKEQKMKDPTKPPLLMVI